MRRFYRSMLAAGATAFLLYSCANIGRPDGGAYDELPPRFLRSTPQAGAVNNTRSRVVLEFDEFIKLENASEKVVVSPPQIQMPEIKPNGKKIAVNLLDSLKGNTTYTIDFSDAIVDNNEGNPLGDFTFTFSTGEVIDTMQVSGTLLDASNLEPIKGMLVGLHANLEDSALVKLPFDRVSRTDSRGRFTIRGIAPGSYRIYALQDANQNFLFDQKSEMLAFHDPIIVPSMESRTRKDTIWKDTITVDTVFTREYTHYLPDDIILRAFHEQLAIQSLVKNERLTPQKFSFYFSAPAETLPEIKGLNFDEEDAFFIEKSLRNDTVHYWIKDSLVYKLDTLNMAVNYLFTDTTGLLAPRTDTLYLASRKINVKEKEKKKKKKDDEPEPTVFLKVTVAAPSSMDIYKNIELVFDEPLDGYHHEGIHLEEKVDTLWREIPFEFAQDSVQLRKYVLRAMWDPEGEYKLSVDSATFRGLYGLYTDKMSQNVKVRSLKDYSTLRVNVTGIQGSAVAQLLDAQDKVVRSQKVENGQVAFFFLNPGKYYLRLFEDRNDNGRWDTGLYEEKRQPEMMYYLSKILDFRADWEYEEDWNVKTVSLDKQKPDEIKKQKPDEDKKKKRDRQRSR